MSSAAFSSNMHRLSTRDIWIPDNRASSIIVNDLAKQQANLRASPFFDKSSTTSSSNSSLSSSSHKINNINPDYFDQTPSIATPLSRQSSSKSIRHKPNTAQLKEYGECYKRLGQGTTAVVMVVRKLGQDGRSEKLYAIKQFRKKTKNESDKEYMKKLTSEFCISSTFSHPNVVETIDLVLDDKKRYCTVMEYCPGGDLFSSIMAERMTNTEKYCCFKQMIQGLAYLHSLGVAHRDIKPENLLLTMDGKLKITDFGVSDVFRFPWESKGRQSRGLVGSEPYIAPESFAQKEYWGACSDMWSAGIVFYCIMMGGLAWHKAKRTDASFCGYTRAYEQGQVFELFKALDHNERRVLHLLLDPNPNTRVTASELLNDTWVKSIQVCEHSKQHKHTEGVQPVCKLAAASK